MAAFRLTAATLFLTYCLVILGGWVHNTGSSLACPDWPLCYGQVFPEMVGGVAIEHSHRLLASAVGLLTVVLVFVCWRAREARETFWLAVVALGLVSIQGVLGGITVLYQLPAAVSTAHLAMSMAYMAILILLAFRLYPRRSRTHGPASRTWVGVAAAALYMQGILGALVRHTSAGLACNVHILTCKGTYWPPDGPAQLHWIHRLAAVLVTALVLGAVVAVVKRERGALRTLAVLAAALVVAQVVLGILAVTTYLGRLPVTAHLGASAVLLACMVTLYFALAPVPALGSVRCEQRNNARSPHHCS